MTTTSDLPRACGISEPGSDRIFCPRSFLDISGQFRELADLMAETDVKIRDDFGSNSALVSFFSFSFGHFWAISSHLRLLEGIDFDWISEKISGFVPRSGLSNTVPVGVW